MRERELNYLFHLSPPQHFPSGPHSLQGFLACPAHTHGWAKMTKYCTITICLTRQVSQEQILIYNVGLPQPSPNPYDAGPIVRRPMGLPITASCDTAWNQTRSVVTPLALRCSVLDR